MILYELLHPGGPTAVGTAPSASGILDAGNWGFLHSLLVIALPLLGFAVVGIHRAQEDNSAFGAIALLAGVGGVMLIMAPIYADAYLFPTIAKSSPETLGQLFTGGAETAYKTVYTLSGLGILVFGIYSWVRGILPKWVAILWIVGSLPADLIQVYLADFIFYRVGTFLIGLAFVGAGIALLGHRGAPATREASAI